MERLVRFACYFRRMAQSDDDDASTPLLLVETAATTAASSTLDAQITRQSTQKENQHEDGDGYANGERLLWNSLESVLLWEDVVSSLFVFLVFNIMFWISVILDFGSFVIICSTTVLMMFWCWADPIPSRQSEILETERVVFYSRIRRLKQMTGKMLHSMMWLRNEQPGMFCILACTASLSIWLFGHVVNGILLAYVIYMIVLLGPVLLRKVPDRMSLYDARRESDSEIEEFLPAATETNIQVLTKAGEIGEYSSTPISTLLDAPNGAINEEQEFLNDGDLMGHKMPSHEDGSSDGLELSDLEISEKSSSSSSSSSNDQSDSEFEIIDQQELGKFHTSQDSILN